MFTVDVRMDLPVLNRLRMANERPVIPDLETIEDKLLEAMPHRRAAAEPV